MPDYRLLALDVDGTLVDRSLVIRPRNLEALRAVMRDGMKVVLATGRMFTSTRRFAETIGTAEPLICYQGAVVQTFDGEVLGEWNVSPASARACVAFAREHELHVNLYRDDRYYVEELGGGADRYASIAQMEPILVPDLMDMAGSGSTKVVFVKSPARLQELQPALRSALGPDARITFSLPDFLEVVSANADKGRALALVAERLGIAPTAVVAVGDAPNDIEMLRFAGLPVAPANASPEALAVAREIIPPPGEDGIAELVDRFLR